MMNGNFEKQDKKFEAFHEGMKNSNKRLEGHELQVPRPRLADVGIREGKFGELKGIATKAGGRRIPHLSRSDNSHCYRHSYRGCYHNRR